MTRLDVALDRTVGDDLLTIAEVSAIVRAPMATLRYSRHLGTGPRSFRLGRRTDSLVHALRRPDPGPVAP
jgi:hypothetical protein